MPTLATSGRFQINGLDLKSVGQSALDGLIALAITIIPMFTLGVSYHFGQYDITPGVVIAEGLIIKALRKYLTDHGQTPPLGAVAPAGSPFPPQHVD